jgi:radical SAM superfamily enzyme YgiQ (UPF0313 family)
VRDAGDILLLSTYELGHQPLHLASPLGFLERAGFRPRAIDLAVEALDEAQVARARLVGIAVPMHTATRLGLRAAARVRRLNPSAHLCFYGLYAPLHRALLEAAGAQSVIGGEYEAELVALVESLERAQTIARDDRAPIRSITLQRLNFAAPQRNALPPLERYARLLAPDGERTAGYLEASRGCLHLCRHCPIPSVYDGRFFVVPSATVLDDARRQIAAGARHLTFGDPDFFNGPGHSMAIVRALHDQAPGVTFDVTIKIEHLLKHRALVPELERLGCAFIVSAVESLDDRVLAALDKGHTRADVEEALAITRDAGVALRPSLVPFTPWETLDGYRLLVDWIEARDLVDQIDPVHLSIRLLIPPRSKLLELDDVRALAGPLDAAQLGHGWAHPDPRMDALQRAVYAAVEGAAACGEMPQRTVARVRSLALAAAEGRALTVEPARAAPAGGARSPHLSETWFC